MSEQQCLFPEAGDGKCSLLQMILVMEDQVNYFCNGTSFIWGAVYILYWDGLFEFNQVEAATFGIVLINEFICHTTIH